MGTAIDAICRKYEVQRLRLFGSAARGEDGPDSDLDLVVDFVKGARPGLFGLAELGEDLESLLGTRVDVTTEAGLHPRMKAKVLAGAEVVWSA
jgi:predicted nucleotidyltransferase